MVLIFKYLNINTFTLTGQLLLLFFSWRYVIIVIAKCSKLLSVYTFMRFNAGQLLVGRVLPMQPIMLLMDYTFVTGISCSITRISECTGIWLDSWRFLECNV